MSATPGRFRKNLLFVLKANVISQALQIASAPLLSRFFSPDDFAIFTVFTSSLTIALSFITLKFEQLMPNATSRRHALNLGALALAFSIAFVGVAMCLNSLVESSNPTITIIKNNAGLFWLCLITGALVQIFQAWFIYIGDLKDSSNGRVINSISSTLFRLLGGFLNWGHFSLLVSIAFGNISSIGYQFSAIYKAVMDSIRGLRRSYVVCTLRRFGFEGIVSALTSLVNAMSLTVLPLLLVEHYSATEVGWYAFISRYSMTPISLITSAVMQSFWAEAASMVRNKKTELKSLYISSTKKLALVSLPIAATCLAARLYVEPLFGAEWKESATILIYMTPMIVGQVIFSPLSHLIIHRKQHWQLTWDIARLCLILIFTTYVAHNSGSIFSAVLINSILGFSMYVILFFLNLRCYKEAK